MDMVRGVGRIVRQLDELRAPSIELHIGNHGQQAANAKRRGRWFTHPCLPRKKIKLNENTPPGGGFQFLRFVS